MTWLALFPEGVPQAHAAGVQRLERRHLQRAPLQPAHAAPFDPLTQNLAARLRRAATHIPTLGAVRRVVRTVAVLPQMPTEFPPLLPGLRRRLRRATQMVQLLH